MEQENLVLKENEHNVVQVTNEKKSQEIKIAIRELDEETQTIEF